MMMIIARLVSKSHKELLYLITLPVIGTRGQQKQSLLAQRVIPIVMTIPLLSWQYQCHDAHKYIAHGY